MFKHDRLSRLKEFLPDLVVFQIGEIVSNQDISESGDHFRSAYTRLVQSIISRNKIVCLPFWADKDKNRIFTEVALETGSSIVDLSHLGGGLEPLNFAHSENKYSHAGVAAHPGDYGMANIAKVIFSVARNMCA